MQFKKAQQERLYQDVLFLTELRPFRNYQNLDSLKRVVDYISNEIEICGLSYSYQSWIAEIMNTEMFCVVTNLKKKKG